MGEAISTATFGTENIPGGYPPGPSGVQRMVVARRELASLIGRALPADGSRQLQPGLFIHRRSRAGGPVHSFADPALCVIVQGSKLVLVGDRRLQYDDEHYLITTANLPLTGQILDASEAKPYLALPETVLAALFFRIYCIILQMRVRLAGYREWARRYPLRLLELQGAQPSDGPEMGVKARVTHVHFPRQLRDRKAARIVTADELDCAVDLAGAATHSGEVQHSDTFTAGEQAVNNFSHDQGR